MKKALLIGKFGKIAGEIEDRLLSVCHVQFCPAHKGYLTNLLAMSTPDLFIVLLSGAATKDSVDEFFGRMLAKYPHTPFIVVGKEKDRDELADMGCFLGSNFTFLARPVDLDEIEETVRSLLNVEPPDNAKRTPAKKAEPEQRRANVFLVDDSQVLLLNMQTMLADKYNVAFATSGEKAVAEITKRQPDLVLLDYDMPECNGTMVLDMLRTNDATKDIPVIFLTGISDKSHVLEILSKQPDGYLLKTCTRERIFATIDEVLEGKSVLTTLSTDAAAFASLPDDTEA